MNEVRVRLNGDPLMWPRAARHFVTGAARSSGFGVPDMLPLLVSEVVTNAMRHGAPPVDVTVRIDGNRARIEVVDCSDRIPVLRPHPPEAESGRGVFLLDRLSDAWGVSRDSSAGKTVWFSLTLPDG